MSTISLAARDSATMLRRDVRHSLQAPAMLVSGMLVPIISCCCSPASSATP